MAAIVITIAIACCAYCSVPPRDLPQVLKAEGPADAESVVHRFRHEDRPGQSSYQPCKASCLAPKPAHFRLGDLTGSRSDNFPVAVTELSRSKPVQVNTASYFLAGRFNSIFDLIASAVTAGCVAALTPCVLATGGMAIGCFARQSDVADSQSLLPLLLFYWSIVAMCTALSFASRLIFGVTRIAGWVDNPWLNIAILLTYCLLIGLMLGMIRCPNAPLAGNCMEGILMGSSFSIATFPIAFSYSSTLLIAVHGNLAWSVLGTVAFASGIAAPFFFLALLPSVLKSLTGSKVFLRTLRMVVSILLLGWFAYSTLPSIAGFACNQPAVTLPTNVREPSTTEFGTNYLIDVDHAIAVATEQQRPLLLEFCYINDVQHSLMNRRVAEPHNRSRMSKFVCAKLFVDTVPLVDRKESKRLLERNHEFDNQPLGKAGSWYQSHVVMSPDGKVVLASFGGIEQKKGEFAAFLDEGWRNWEDFQAGHFPK
jgi:hypothetical protein